MALQLTNDALNTGLTEWITALPGGGNVVGSVVTSLKGTACTLSNGAAVNGSPFNASKWNNGAFNYDGSNDLASIPDAAWQDLGTNWTMSQFVRLANTTQSCILQWTNNGAAWLYQNKNLNFNRTNLVGACNNAWSAFLANTWYMIHITRNGNAYAQYVNGVLLGTDTDANAITATAAAWQMGGGTAGFYQLGQGDHYRIWAARTLTAQEVADDYAVFAATTGNNAIVPKLINDLTDINSTLTANGQQGVAFSYTITGTNNPTVFAATGLPTGVSINTATGQLTGTPSVNGTFNVSISATNNVNTDSDTLVITLLPPAPVIDSATTKSGTVGTALTYQITSSAGTPASYSASGLPTGCSINTATGAITGTPSAAGTFNATIGATNTGGSDSKGVTFTIAKRDTTTSLAASPTNLQISGQNVTLTATVSNGTGTVEFFNGATSLGAPVVVSGGTAAKTLNTLPVGVLTLRAVYSGDANNNTSEGTRSYEIYVPAPPVIDSPLTANGVRGVAFSYTIHATNAPTSYGATGLPSGLSINTGTGAITGTPAAAGTTNVTITATNADGTDSKTLVISVAAPQTGNTGATIAILAAIAGEL